MVNIAMFSGEEKILETILDRAMILAIGVEFIKDAVPPYAGDGY